MPTSDPFGGLRKRQTVLSDQAGAFEAPIDARAVTIDDMVPPDARRADDAYRVVVADDEATICELMRTVLSLEPDFEVVGQAGDGLEAVALVEELRPDLVVIDISMPMMDGRQAIERIRQVAPATRVAVLSGEPRPQSTGADTHIEKGTPNDVVVAILRSLCQGTVSARPAG